MPDRGEERTAERLDRMIGDLLAGRHLKATPSDAHDRHEVRLAARLAGTRDGYPRMSPPFRRRLTKMLEKGEAPSWLNRRAALVAGLSLTVGAVGGALAQQLGGLLGEERASHGGSGQPSGGAAATRGMIEPTAETARWVDTGITFAELADGLPRRVNAGAIGVVVIRRADQ